MAVGHKAVSRSSYRATAMGDRIALIHESASAVRISELEVEQAETLAHQIYEALEYARSCR